MKDSIIDNLHGINGNVKTMLKELITEKLEAKKDKRAEIEGELWDGTQIFSVSLMHGNIVFNDHYELRACNVACTEDLFWIAEYGL